MAVCRLFSKGLSLSEAWKAYKRERRVELVHEGDRYWSLLRWGKRMVKKQYPN